MNTMRKHGVCLVNKDRYMCLNEAFPTEINPLGLKVRSKPQKFSGGLSGIKKGHIGVRKKIFFFLEKERGI